MGSSHQSPIDIRTRNVGYDSLLKPLKFHYDPKTSKRIFNTGHCFNVEFDDQKDISLLSGGPLTGHYRLCQFHFHWGLSDSEGSEHTIDGKAFPAELHIVHWNSQKYRNFSEAKDHPDGLSVVGILLKLGEKNPALQAIVENLDKVKTKGKECRFTTFDLSSLLPKDLNYWTYHGSLTTNPWSECVTWIILQEFITITPTQLEKFRSLLSTEQDNDPCNILENHREIQALQGRVVRSSCAVNKKTNKKNT
ncbi:carbonic anhydrase 2-like [Spea bombifrons]|uniref:carbonic anhydrase 2-like n=1 Tax=Spea bombifrons TaxID=233779 RepID=UPI00234B8B87|nr:carbonic anhydrase 2-like [Spea bombifrons]